jgi:RNA polymerase sigma-70 factor (ECF subfamily)
MGLRKSVWAIVKARLGSATARASFRGQPMGQEPTAEELLARVARRDDGALAELYDRFAPGLLGMLLKILPDRDAAEEVLLDVYLRLWNDARRWSSEQASVPAALVLLARGIAVGRLRVGRHPSPSTSTRGEPLLKFYSWLPRPQQVGLLDGRRELFKKVINQLPKPQREALELAVYGGYTEIEIAQKVGEPIARVRSGLLAAGRFIRHRLAAVMRTWAANI